MKPIIFPVLLILLIFGTIARSRAQNNPDSSASKPDCVQEDIFDVVFKKEKLPGITVKRKFRILAIPTISYTPVTGLQLGAGGSLSWYWGKKPKTKLSAGLVSAVWTTERQVILQVKNNIFTSDNDWFLQTDWRLYFFRMDTWGLSTNAGNVAYPMIFNWIKFHNVISREITDNIYAGIGYHLDYHYNVQDKTAFQGDSLVTPTPYTTYSTLHGFNFGSNVASGLSLNFAYDSRDNIINAYKGIYVNVNYRYNFRWLGSDKEGSQVWTEFRTYIGLSKKVPRHLLAFWLFGSFQVSGDIPYFDLMALGFDQMNSSGRGYKQGRWRGEDFVYGEMEYRFPISRCSGIVGGVLFANVTTSSDRDNHVPLFGYLKPGAGFGIRIMVGKHDRTNLLIDFALGDLSSGFYFQAQEVF